MSNPYREQVAPDLNDEPQPAHPVWPTGEKWRDPLWRRFFEIVLAGSLPALTVGASPSPVALLDEAESIADETYRRAKMNGATM